MIRYDNEHARRIKWNSLEFYGYHGSLFHNGGTSYRFSLFLTLILMMFDVIFFYIWAWVEMSLALFSVGNNYYKNGKLYINQVFGGSLKCSTELLGNKDMTLSESQEGFSRTSSTIWDNICSIASSSRALT